MPVDPDSVTHRGLLIVGLRLLAAYAFIDGYNRLTIFLDFRFLDLTDPTQKTGVNPTVYLYYAGTYFLLAFLLAVFAPKVADWAPIPGGSKPERRNDLA